MSEDELTFYKMFGTPSYGKIGVSGTKDVVKLDRCHCHIAYCIL